MKKRAVDSKDLELLQTFHIYTKILIITAKIPFRDYITSTLRNIWKELATQIATKNFFFEVSSTLCTTLFFLLKDFEWRTTHRTGHWKIYFKSMQPQG